MARRRAEFNQQSRRNALVTRLTGQPAFNSHGGAYAVHHQNYCYQPVGWVYGQQYPVQQKYIYASVASRNQGSKTVSTSQTRGQQYPVQQQCIHPSVASRNQGSKTLSSSQLYEQYSEGLEPAGSSQPQKQTVSQSYSHSFPRNAQQPSVSALHSISDSHALAAKSRCNISTKPAGLFKSGNGYSDSNTLQGTNLTYLSTMSSSKVHDDHESRTKHTTPVTKAVSRATQGSQASCSPPPPAPPGPSVLPKDINPPGVADVQPPLPPEDPPPLPPLHEVAPPLPPEADPTLQARDMLPPKNTPSHSDHSHVIDLTQSSGNIKESHHSSLHLGATKQAESKAAATKQAVLRDITNQRLERTPVWLKNLQASKNDIKQTTQFDFTCRMPSSSESIGSTLEDTCDEDDDVQGVVERKRGQDAKAERMKPSLIGKVHKKRAHQHSKAVKQQVSAPELQAVVELLNDQVAALKIDVTDLESDEQFSTNGHRQTTTHVVADDSTEDGEVLEFLTYEEYVQAVKEGHIGQYRGTKVKTAEEKYAQGWAIRRSTHAWAKVVKAAAGAGQSTMSNNSKQKAASKGTVHVGVTSAQEGTDGAVAGPQVADDKASKLRDQLGKLEQQLEAIQLQMRQREAENSKAGDDHQSCSQGGGEELLREFVAFDTNVFLNDLPLIKAWLQAAGKEPSRYRRLLVPKAVLRELDGLKKNVLKGKQAREATRMLEEVQRGPLYRGQREDEVYFAHIPPAFRKGDDGILDCLLYFQSTGGHMCLVSHDRNLRLRVNNHHIRALPPDELLAKA